MVNNVSRLGRLLATLFFVFVAAIAAPQTATAGPDWRLTLLESPEAELTPANGIVEYTVGVENFGDAPAPATTVTLTIPATTNFTGTADGATITNCTPTPATGPTSVVCDVPPLAIDEAVSAVIQIQALEEGSILFAASADDPGGVDDDTGNNFLQENTTIEAGSDIGVEIVPPASASSGEFVDIIVEATNNGPNDSDGFTVAFPIPTGMGGITAPPNCTLDGTTYICDISELPVGDTISLTFNGQVLVTESSTIPVTASVQGASPTDANAANNTDDLIFPVSGGVDLAVDISSDAEGTTLLTGDPVTFTIESSYTGDEPNDIEIVHVIPDNFDFDIADFTAPGWTITQSGPEGRTITFTRATAPPAGAEPGAVAFGTIVMPMVTAIEGNPISEVGISASGPTESNIANNTDSVITQIIDPTIDLRANKSGPRFDLAVVGQSYDYTISTTNVGNAQFDGDAIMVDQVPAGLTVTSVNQNGWVCTPAAGGVGPFTLTCRLDATTIASGATTPAVTYTALVTQEGSLPNTLTVSAENGNLPDEFGPNDTITIDVGAEVGGNSADVGLIKTVLEPTRVAGEEQTYTLEITNTGPSTSQDIAVRDDFLQLINNGSGPDEGFVSVSLNPGPNATGLSCGNSAFGSSGRRLDCTIDSLAVCTPGVNCPTIDVVVRHGGNGGPIDNTASAFSLSTPDGDLTNNEDDTTFVQEPRVDVTVVKTVNAPTVAVGQNVTYTVAAINVDNGLSDAENVILTDDLPADTLFISVSPTSSCTSSVAAGEEITAGDTVVCDFGTLANGEQQAATIIVRPLRTALDLPNMELINDVAVTTTTPETDVEPNTDSVTTMIEPPVTDILVNKTDVGFDPLELGQEATYLISVFNRGPSASQDIVAIDTMPNDTISFVSATLQDGTPCGTNPPSPAPGSFDVIISCEWPYLEPGEGFTIEVVGLAEAKGNTLNRVEVESFEINNGFDSVSGNNFAEENTTVRTRAELVLDSKVATPGTVALEDDFVYDITVSVQAGLGEAEEVVITDTLPAGMFLTGPPTTPFLADACLPAIAGNTSFSCVMGDVPAGTTFVITVPVEVRAFDVDGGTLTNSVTGSTASFENIPLDDPNTNNIAEGPVTVVSSEISGTVYRDFDKDVSQNLTEDTGVQGVPMVLTGVTGDGRTIAPITVLTDSNGDYIFPNLPAGDYTVTRGAVPSVLANQYLEDGVSDVGDNGATGSTPLTIVNIPLGDDDVGPNNDFTLNPMPQIGIAKAVQGPIVVNADGSFEVAFRMIVENLSAEALEDVAVTDVLTGAAPLFGTLATPAAPATDALAPATYAMLSAPTGSCGTMNAGFNGSGDQALSTGATLAVNGSCQIDFRIRVQPPSTLPAAQASGGIFENQADVTGVGVLTGDPVFDTSDNGTNPDPNNNNNANQNGENDPTPVSPPFNPSIELVKSSDNSGFSTPPQPLDTITYEFEITNNGNLTLTNIQLNDDLDGIVLNSNSIAVLEPMQTVTLTGSYQIDLDDINAGEVPNEADVTADDVFGEEVTDTSDTTTEIDQVASIALIKLVDTNGIQDPTNLNDPVTYSFEVRNTGNVTLYDVVVTDPLPGLTMSGAPIAELAPGATDVGTFTADHGITQQDIDDGEVVNQATVSALDPNDDPVSDLSGDTFDVDNPIVLPTFQNPSIALIKTADTSGLSIPPLAGEFITYTFTVTNTGNTTLQNITLDDPLPDVILEGGPILSLAPDGVDTDTFRAAYELKQDDINLGEVVNQATVMADVPGGGTVDDPSGTTNGDDDPTVVPLAQNPAVALIKIADVTALSDPPVDGEIITWTFEVRNTGNVTLTDLTVEDTLLGIISNGAVLASLDPGDTDLFTFEATYEIDQNDIDGRFLENTATVTGTAPDDSEVTDVSGTTFETDEPTIVDFEQLPAITLVKTVDTSALSSPPQEGDVLTYAFSVRNAGNVTLTDITLEEQLDGAVLTGGPIAALTPGETDDTTFAATYVLTQDDVDMGVVENLATATGTPPTGPPVTDDSGTTPGEDAPIVTPLAQGPLISLVKAADTSALQSPPQVGDVISYSFTVTNTGNVRLTDIVVEDLMPGLVLDAPTIPSLNPGQSDSTTVTATYVLTTDDLTNGTVDNTATVVGMPPFSPTVTDDSETSTPIAQEPGITLDKIGDGSALADGAVVGEIITYTFVVTNTGNVPLSNVTVTDPKPGLTLIGDPIPLMNPASVADGTDVDSITYTATYAITAADVANVEVENTATVTGEFGTTGETVSAEDTEIVVAGNIEAISEPITVFDGNGGTTTSILESDLLNGGDVTLDNVTIDVISEDEGVTLDPTTGLITLDEDQPAGIYEVVYQITSIDFPDLVDQAVETVVQGAVPAIETTKTQVLVDNGDGVDDVGDTVVYTITVENTGNVPLDNVGVVDTLTDLNGVVQTLTSGPTFDSADAGSPEGRLEIGEVATYEATFVLTVDVVNATGLENTVTATGTPDIPDDIPGNPDPVSDVSDDGDNLDGNTTDDPTVLNLTPTTTDEGLTIIKTTPRVIVERGSVVPYTITVTNDNPFVVGPTDVIDSLPAGFLYVEGSGTITGSTGTIEVSGSQITFADLLIPAEGTVEITLSARILNGTRWGRHVNQATIIDPVTGELLAPPTTATVEILPDPIFDCTDIIGKVFDDVNGNGYQDGPASVGDNPGITDQTYGGGKFEKWEELPEGPRPERGLPGVRVATVDGTVITTDANGLFSVPCAALPASAGSNFILKLDERSLPTGYSMTTNNPSVMRLTPGMMSEMNFGARLGNVIAINLNANAFAADGALSPALVQGITTLVRRIANDPAGIELAYHVPANAGSADIATARAALDLVENEIARQWRSTGRGRLSIEQRIARAEQ